MIAFFALAMIVGFVGMILASRVALDSATVLAAGTRVPPFLIGMTVLAIGTDLPEIANSVVASWSDHGDVNVGDSMGSAVTQLTLVLGLLPLIVGSVAVTARGLVATGWFAVVGLVVIRLVTGDDFLDRVDGGILVGVWLIGSFLIYRRVRNPLQLSLPEDPPPRIRLIAKTLAGLGVVAAAAMVALWGLVEFADELGAPEFLLSFFLASLGTSLPELVFDVTAVRRGEVDLAVGDIFGSSFVDATLAVGIGPLLFPNAVTGDDILPAALAAIVAVALVTITASRIRVHDWRTGSLLLILYAAFFFLLLL